MATADCKPRLSVAYWRLWWAAGIDSVGDGAFTAAVPLLVITITRDPRLVSMVAAVTYSPWLLLSLPAGALVDRNDRVGLMWRAQSIQALIAGAVAILVAVGHIGILGLAIMAFGLGACEVVFSNAAQSNLPDLVPKALLHKANGNQQTIVVAGEQFVGPPIGSLSFAVAMALPFGLDTLSFVLSAALLVTLPRNRRLERRRPPMRKAVAQGVGWLTRHRLLRTLAALLGVNNFCSQLGNATLVLLATQTLHVNARGYGLLLAAAAIGSMLGGLVNARIVGRIGALPALLLALAINVPVFIGIGLSPTPLVLGGLLAMNGFVVTLWNVVTVSLRQEIVPPELLGRVNSIYRMFGWGLIPLGALASGLLAHGFGLRAPYPIAGVLRALAMLLATPVLIRALRERSGRNI